MAARLKTLPKNPSALIRLALDDVVKTEQHPKDIINMERWCERRPNGGCSVCFGGAIMRQSLGARSGWPDRFGFEIEHQLYALNAFRVGYIITGLTQVGIDPVKNRQADGTRWKDRKITGYAVNPEKFKQQMAKLADDLEKAGI